jgi:hypothetical protein
MSQCTLHKLQSSSSAHILQKKHNITYRNRGKKTRLMSVWRNITVGWAWIVHENTIL